MNPGRGHGTTIKQPPGRLRAILISAAMVVASVVGYGLSDSDAKYEPIRGRVDDVVKYNHGTAHLDRVQVGTTLSKDGEDVLETAGLFVAVRLTVEATGRERVRVGNATLVSSTASFDALDLVDTMRVEPGFEASKQLIFEVDPQQLAELSFQGSNRGVVNGYYQQLDIDLGFSAATVSEQVSEGQGRTIEVDSNESIRGLR